MYFIISFLIKCIRTQIVLQLKRSLKSRSISTKSSRTLNINMHEVVNHRKYSFGTFFLCHLKKELAQYTSNKNSPIFAPRFSWLITPVSVLNKQIT